MAVSVTTAGPAVVVGTAAVHDQGATMAGDTLNSECPKTSKTEEYKNRLFDILSDDFMLRIYILMAVCSCCSVVEYSKGCFTYETQKDKYRKTFDLLVMETTGTLDRRGSTVEVDRRCQAGVDMQVTG